MPELEIGVVGLGATGARIARALVESAEVATVVVRGSSPDREPRVVRALGDKAMRWASGAPSVTVIATPPGTHLELARAEVEQGRHVVSTSADLDEIESLFGLGPLAAELGVGVIAGAAMSPGLSTVLACHAAELFDEVTEVHVGMLGAGGHACVEQRARALAADGLEWREGEWLEAGSGSGKELLWFPDPIGARDCARGRFAEPVLLHRVFPGASRLSARGAVERAERWIGRFAPRQPLAPDGEPGAIRVEVHGRRDQGLDTVVYAAMDRPALAAAITAAVAAIGMGLQSPAEGGVVGLAEAVEPVPFLTELARRGVRAATALDPS
ncbi:MAG TPA: hypothetical protein VJM33_14935 [Microthrixaceae bacterium]|nr:hypothetical protein [Microthrixaceae bacterium]